MVFKYFRIQVVLRVIGIALASLALAWSIYETEFLMTPIVFGLFTLIQVVFLVMYLERSTRLLDNFISSFSDKDYMRKFEPQYEGKAFKELSSSINQLLDEYSRLSLEKEGQYQYVKLINEHVQIPLISFKEDGKIDLINKSAQELLKSPLLYRFEDISKYEPGLAKLISSMPSNKRELYKSSRLKLAVSTKKFTLSNEAFTLVAMQDISKELQANELDAWQKLIRVLTHEIMNSMTPVLSLSTAIREMVDDENSPRKIEEIDQEQINDIHRSIKAIENRGIGLLNFVNAYKDYTRLPELKLEKTDLNSLINEVLLLIKKEFKQLNIEIKYSFSPKSPGFETMVDSKLISQVVINLLKNAKEALLQVDQPEVEIFLNQDDLGYIITISDNGPGIPEELREDVFVPFYTTKKQGSGIGLSLSRQIIRAHGGNLSLQPFEIGSKFEVRLA